MPLPIPYKDSSGFFFVGWVETFCQYKEQIIMNVKIITYDLSKPGQSYSEFYKVIKSYTWARLSESSYAVETIESSKAIYDKLSRHIDKNDQVYIIPLRSPYNGWGPEEVNNWLRQRL